MYKKWVEQAEGFPDSGHFSGPRDLLPGTEAPEPKGVPVGLYYKWTRWTRSPYFHPIPSKKDQIFWYKIQGHVFIGFPKSNI